MISCFSGTPFFQSDTDKDVCFALVGNTVIEFGNAPRTDRFAKVQEASRPFRNGYAKQGFELFAHRGAFRDMAQARKVDIGAGQNRRGISFTTRPVEEKFLEAGNGQGTGRLGDGARILVNILHGCADFVAVDGDDFIE